MTADELGTKCVELTNKVLTSYVRREHYAAARDDMLQIINLAAEAGGKMALDTVEEGVRDGVLTVTSALN